MYSQVSDAERRASAAEASVKEVTQMSIIAQALQQAESKAHLAERELSKAQKTAELVEVLKQRLAEAEGRSHKAHASLRQIQASPRIPPPQIER